MVEGHSVHRIAVAHGTRLVGRKFRAVSPNGRFSDGARLIDGREFSRIEAIGKNLFAFFSAVGAPDVVMHVHFGMSGRWSVADAARAPEPTATTRLTLEGHGLVSHLSAMTVDHGGPELFEKKRRALGHDPLRSDANPEALWRKVSGSSKSIGLLLMDQSAFAGLGNIFRCEILHVARVHPEIKGDQLTRAQFDAIWDASARLMRNAFTLGSIVTVFPQEAAALGRPTLRRLQPPELGSALAMTLHASAHHGAPPLPPQVDLQLRPLRPV
jgi:formamidopyrimidine-DNA glycosylase